ncbi:MAG TPA: sigma-70 family RNA polymerase sigma factor [Thermoleophilaceae bacterium]|nr:sigma-70 family RNA polymerase sigma factor [Thermoleophilaceae bacterium]
MNPITSISARRRTAIRLPKRVLARRSDQQLMELVHSGDDGAFEVLYERHAPGVLSFCRHMLGSQEEAEETVQHAFVSVHLGLLQATGGGISFKPWVYTIARNRCSSLLRERRAQAVERSEPSTAGLRPEVEQRSDLREIIADIERLPEEQRAAFVLAELRDLSFEEIAEVVDEQPATIKGLVFRARSTMIERREARRVDCLDVRESLETASRDDLARGPLRYHLDICPDCTAYFDSMRRQRKLLGLALPVVPAVALKESVMASVGGGGAGVGVGAGTGAGAGAGTGAGAGAGTGAGAGAGVGAGAGAGAGGAAGGVAGGVAGGAIAGGAATTGASLLGGGVLAKVAVMGALAAGTGVAAEAVRENEPGGADSPPADVRGAAGSTSDGASGAAAPISPRGSGYESQGGVRADEAHGRDPAKSSDPAAAGAPPAPATGTDPASSGDPGAPASESAPATDPLLGGALPIGRDDASSGQGPSKEKAAPGGQGRSEGRGPKRDTPPVEPTVPVLPEVPVPTVPDVEVPPVELPEVGGKKVKVPKLPKALPPLPDAVPNTAPPGS